MCFLQDDIVKFVSEPVSPPRLVEIPDEGKGKAKERCEVSEGDDTVVIEDTSEEDDEETLQKRFQLRSRFSRLGLPHVPLVQDPPTSLEASLPAPPRRPCNMARKRVDKKLKVTETTSQEVSFEGPIRRTREGWSEWESIKVLLEGDGNSHKMNTAFQHTSPTHYPKWPSPRNHWGATGPRNQHTTF
jgi:hypothetical protein